MQPCVFFLFSGKSIVAAHWCLKEGFLEWRDLGGSKTDFLGYLAGAMVLSREHCRE